MKRNCSRRSALFSMVFALSLFPALVLFTAPAAHADYTYTVSETLANFGHLVQPAFPASTVSNPNDNSAYYVCAQTALVNSFVYLQNQYGTTYSRLVPGGDMDAAARALNGSPRYVQSNWTKDSNGNWQAGVLYGSFSWGTYHYVWNQMGGTSSTPPTANTYFYAETNSLGGWTTSWGTNSPANAYGKSEIPSWALLYNGLALGDAVVIEWSAAPGNTNPSASHYMTVTGLSFNPGTDTGTLTYIDPKYSGSAITGTISLSGGTIVLNYVPNPPSGTSAWASGPVDINMALVFGPNQVSSMDSPVPIPSAVWLFVPGLACLAAFRKRIRK